MVSDISHDDNFANNFINTINKLNGNYSIAFTFKQYDQIFLTSNCGSLFYYHDKENSFFSFASEKKILIDYINTTRFVKNKKMDSSQNQSYDLISLIFNPLKNELSLIELKKEKNNFNYKLSKAETNEKSKTITNYEEDFQRHSKLQKCNKCILIETYPYIEFDNDGVCNFCKSYEKQVYYGEKKTI